MKFNNSQYFIFKKELISNSGKKAKIYELRNDIEEEAILDDWARSLRDYYIEEHMIDILLSGTGLTKKEYLAQNIFPSTHGIGAATMSGEFGEILVYDLIQYKMDYYISKTRYLEKVNPDLPVSGSDVIGYKVEDIKSPQNDDKLFVGEVKVRASEKSRLTLDKNPISDAIKDSGKDRIRIAESLNAEKRRAVYRNKIEEIKVIERFQNKTDTPYQLNFSAIAIFTKALYSEEFILQILNNIADDEETNILIIYSDKLLEFLRDLYRRACIC
ncbi:MAG: DUF1837 domain-containing protein [Tissierellia bacterium]|nr:DUF1837 domain-containing protein [Tissierellia bacterium]